MWAVVWALLLHKLWKTLTVAAATFGLLMIATGGLV